MNAEEWHDLLEGLVYVFAQPIMYLLAFMVVISFLAGIFQFLSED
jgi:hypothetical protein